MKNLRVVWTLEVKHFGKLENRICVEYYHNMNEIEFAKTLKCSYQNWKIIKIEKV
jgi:hypothetical protein